MSSDNDNRLCEQIETLHNDMLRAYENEDWVLCNDLLLEQTSLIKDLLNSEDSIIKLNKLPQLIEKNAHFVALCEEKKGEMKRLIRQLKKNQKQHHFYINHMKSE